MVRFGTTARCILALIAFNLGCGNSERPSSQAAGAAAGSGGTTAGNGGTSGGSAGGAVTAGQSGGGGLGPNPQACPELEPASGTDCSPEGLACRYPGECCAVTARCIVNAGTWGIVPECGPTCPTEPPAAGSACDPCRDRPSCAYDSCGDGSGEVVTATCNDGPNTWSVESASCGPVTCGTQTCAANQICVTSFNSCVDNPCLDEPLSCACAQPACGAPSGWLCATVEPRKVFCICQTC